MATDQELELLRRATAALDAGGHAVLADQLEAQDAPELANLKDFMALGARADAAGAFLETDELRRYERLRRRHFEAWSLAVAGGRAGLDYRGFPGRVALFLPRHDVPPHALALEATTATDAEVARLVRSPAAPRILHLAIARHFPLPRLGPLLRAPCFSALESLVLPFDPETVSALTDCPRRAQLRSLGFHDAGLEPSAVSATAGMLARLELPRLSSLTLDQLELPLAAAEQLATMQPVRSLAMREGRVRAGGLRALMAGSLTRELQCLSLDRVAVEASDVIAVTNGARPLRALRLDLREAEPTALLRALEGFALPRLRRLTVQNAPLSPAAVQELAWSPAFRNLETLALSNCSTPPEALESLVRSDSLGALRHLAVRASKVTDEVAQALVAGPLPKRLVTLDFSKNALEPPGVRALVTAAFPELEELRARADHFPLEAARQLYRNRGVPKLTATDLQGHPLLRAFLDGVVPLEEFSVEGVTQDFRELARSPRGRGLKVLQVEARNQRVSPAAVARLLELEWLDRLEGSMALIGSRAWEALEAAFRGRLVHVGASSPHATRLRELPLGARA
jgi:hypothetical protein